MDGDKMVEHFGEAFYNKVLADLPKYAEKWNLSNFEQIDYYSWSCLFTCISEQYGDCVLKIGSLLELTQTEYHLLKDFGGNGLCKIYEADVDNGVLLIERIMPGTQLSDEPSQDARINEFCSLVQKLHKPPANMDKYDTYMEWVSEITTFIKTRPDYAGLCQKMIKAEGICQPLWEKYTDRLLLHGDLHLENILLGKDGYCAIDPMGVIGDPVFNVTLFILDEIDWDTEGNFEYVVKTISTKLNIPEQDIRALLYIEACRVNCCYVEDGDYDEVDMDVISLVERMM
ncbi:MAG: aminoglycoside phosphotransferase family protein [Defluviitaleaceae bacterium]|nr:aminoglycoside phosphotransferase family protein [Defluviitaleaceae bacterium]